MAYLEWILSEILFNEKVAIHRNDFIKTVLYNKTKDVFYPVFNFDFEIYFCENFNVQEKRVIDFLNKKNNNTLEITFLTYYSDCKKLHFTYKKKISLA